MQQKNHKFAYGFFIKITGAGSRRNVSVAGNRKANSVKTGASLTEATGGADLQAFKIPARSSREDKAL